MMNLFSRLQSARVAMFLCAFGGAVATHAHPGHDLDSQGVAHVVASPYHLATLALAGATLLAGGSLVSKAPVRRALQCSGAVCLVMTVLLGLRA